MLAHHSPKPVRVEAQSFPSPLKLLLGSAAAIALAALVIATAQVILVLFAGTLLAIVLLDSSRWLADKTHIPRGVCLTLLVLLGLGLIATFIVLSAGTLVEQFSALVKAIPKVLERVLSYLRSDPLAQSVTRIFPNAKPGETGAGGEGVARGAFAALGAVTRSLEFVGALAVIFFVGVYGSAQPDLHVRALLSVTPEQHHQKVHNALDQVRRTLSRWMLGRLVAMAFVGITTGVAFHLLDLPAALTLAVFAGLLTFVEYAGAIISAIPPVLLGFAQGPSTALAVLAVFSVLHVIEGYVLTPLLARAAVHVPPAYAVASQALFGVLLGPLGLTFSTPVIVTVATAFKALREPTPANE